MIEPMTRPVLVNLTAHPIEVMDPRTGAVAVTLALAGRPARAEMTRQVVHELLVGDAIVPVHRNVLGPPSSIPDPVPGTLYVVSRAYAEAARAHGLDRHDLVVPDEAVRGAEGRVVGCRAFALIR